MKEHVSERTRMRLVNSLFAVVVTALVLFASVPARAESWNGIEPLKSKRADVERALGAPVENVPGETGTLRFKVAGGTVTVFFVTAKFIESKKLDPTLEGTVLQIILQHDRASDTPESLNLVTNGAFDREVKGDVTVYRNLKDGVIYTFVGGQLKTSRFSPPAETLARTQRKGDKN